MNRTEAINILKPAGNGQDELKAAWRAACKLYHPDINPHGLELMKVVNTAYEFLQRNIGKWSHGQGNDDTPLTDVLQGIFDKIKHFPEMQTEVCGSWLWTSGQTWRYKKQLKEFGFKWAGKKRQWYWSPPGYKKRGRKVFSMDEIRATFGSQDLEQELNAAVG